MIFEVIIKTSEEMEQWKENTSTEETVISLIENASEISLENIKEIHVAIQIEDERAVTEFTSLLRLLVKKTKKSVIKHIPVIGGMK